MPTLIRVAMTQRTSIRCRGTLTRATASGFGTGRVYLTRRGEDAARVANETRLLDVLRRVGFAIVDPRELTFMEQVALFANTRALVSIHGAGMTNCIFMPPGGRVLELYGKSGRIRIR